MRAMNIDLINEEIDRRAKVSENGNVTYQMGPEFHNAVISFYIEKARPNWKILKDEYPTAYKAMADEIFDEIHPY